MCSTISVQYRAKAYDAAGAESALGREQTRFVRPRAHHMALVNHIRAAHAYEHRALGCGEQGLRDGGLCREGIDRKDGVGIAVANDSDVGRVHERLDTAAKKREAARILDGIGYGDGRFAQGSLDGRGVHGQDSRRGYGVGRGRQIGVDIDFGKIDRGVDALLDFSLMLFCIQRGC